MKSTDKQVGPNIGVHFVPVFEQKNVHEDILHEGNPVRLIDAAKSLLLDKVVTENYIGQKYSAVSHVWNGSIMQINLRCENSVNYAAELERKTANLKKLYNIWRLLRDMVENGIRYVWIDALCINQSNENEVRGQMLVMANIYNKSFKTIIYMRKIGSNQSILNDEGKVGDWPTRVWTLQEAIYCRNPLVAMTTSNGHTKYVSMHEWYPKARSLLRCYLSENTSTSYNKLHASEISGIPYKVCHEMNKVNTCACFTMPKAKIPVHEIFVQTSSRECEVPADRINGILGKLRNVTTAFDRREKLYIAVKSVMINCEKDVRVFLLCCSQEYNLPKSWIPTLDRKIIVPRDFNSYTNIVSCIINNNDNIEMHICCRAIRGKLNLYKKLSQQTCPYEIYVQEQELYKGKVHVDNNGGFTHKMYIAGEISLGCVQQIGHHDMSFDVVFIPINIEKHCKAIIVTQVDECLYRKLGIIIISKRLYESSPDKLDESTYVIC
jgi:hypothetical protein